MGHQDKRNIWDNTMLECQKENSTNVILYIYIYIYIFFFHGKEDSFINNQHIDLRGSFRTLLTYWKLSWNWPFINQGHLCSLWIISCLYIQIYFVIKILGNDSQVHFMGAWMKLNFCAPQAFSPGPNQI